MIPSLIDPTVAPPGKHVMSCFVQYAPYHLAEGAADWPDQREAFGDAVVDTLAEYLPEPEGPILHRQVLTPWDLEQEFGLTEGNIFHGELSLEQLAFLRPAAGWAATGRRCATSGCAAPARIPAAASWARPARSAPARCSRRGRSDGARIRWPATTRS